MNNQLPFFYSYKLIIIKGFFKTFFLTKSVSLLLLTTISDAIKKKYLDTDMDGINDEEDEDDDNDGIDDDEDEDDNGNGIDDDDEDEDSDGIPNKGGF